MNKYDPKNFKWDWCFLCDAPHARCPRCDVNSCACGCLREGFKLPSGECPEQEWWDAQYGEAYETERAKHKRPTKERLIEFVRKLSELPADRQIVMDMSCDVVALLKHCKWYGIPIKLVYTKSKDRSNPVWAIKLLE